MINPKQIIIDNLDKWLKSKNIDAKFEVSLSQNPQFGDFTTNIVMQISKELNKNPRELAEEIKSEIEITDNRIDQEVYKIYDLSEDEIKIVEENTK